MRILFISSEHALIEGICDALADFGHVVDAVPVADLPGLRFHAPHQLVILDAAGAPHRVAEMLERLREIEPVARMLLIGERFALHGRVAAAERGVDAFIARPVTAAALSDGIRRATALRRP